MKKISTSLALKLRQDSIVERDYIIFSGEETKHYIWFNLYDDCYNNGNFIGTFVMKRLELTYNDGDLEFKQKEFNAYKEYKLDDGTWESIDYGTFIVQAVEESDTKEEIKVTAYDYTLKFANTYVSDLDYQSGEITLLQVLQECCDKCGIELATTEFANSSFKVDSNQFDGLSMYGNVIGAVAGISCNFAKIKADNKLYLEFKTETGIIIEASDYEEFEDKRDTLEYNAVSLGMANVEGENVTMVAKGVDPEKAKFLTINDNQFAYTIEKRNELITAIFNKINGFSYSSIVLKNCMFPQLECGDLIQVRNKDGQLVNSIVLRPTYEETQIKLEAPSTISSTVSYLNPPEAYDIAKLTQIEVDKAIGQIQSLTIRTEQIVDNINNNYYTVTQTNELIQTAESGITNTFSESGGNNILRNTGLWFKNDGEDSKKDKTIIGSNIKLFDALDETVNNVRINGYTKQNGIPTPDNPQEVEVAKGNNLLPTNVSAWEQGTLTTQGANSSSTTRIRTIDYYNIKTGIDYYISVEDTNYSFVNIFLYDKNKTFVVSYSSILNISGTKGTKINIPSSYNVSYMRVILQKSGATTITADEVENIKPMIVKGSTKIDFEPYNSIVAKSNGKNLFKTTPINSGGMTVKMDKNGILTINGTATRSWADVTARFNIELPIDTYAFSIDRPISLPVRFKGAYDDGTIVEYEIPAGSTYIIKTIPKKIKTLYVFIFGLSAGVKVENLSFGIQIEEGTIATDYKPYQESKLTYSLNDNFLAEQDYIQDNKLYKNVEKVVLNGSEEWKDNWQNSATPDYIQFYLPADFLSNNYKPANVMPAFSNRFKVYVTVWNYNEECIGLNMSTTQSLQIKFKKSRISNLSELKQWLSENPVEIYYQLEAPTTVDLEPIGELKTYKDYTSISNNVNTEMEINYKAIYSLYEYWIGKATRKTNEKAVNSNSIVIQKGSFIQEQEVPDGIYSICFKYKKLIQLAKTKVKINDFEYDLSSLEDKEFYTGEKDNETGEYITQPLEVSSRHINIEFISDTNNAIEIYDLMCNKGNVKLAYSQNQNETTTDTVNISKGITITSSYMETIFKANANGIKILTLQGETIAYFTEKGLTTKEAIIEEKAEICGTLITDVGDQTWFTRM